MFNTNRVLLRLLRWRRLLLLCVARYTAAVAIATTCCCCPSSYTCHPRLFIQTAGTAVVYRTYCQLFCITNENSRVQPLARHPLLCGHGFYTSHGHPGHARSRRRASVHRGDATLERVYNKRYDIMRGISRKEAATVALKVALIDQDSRSFTYKYVGSIFNICRDER